MNRLSIAFLATSLLFGCGGSHSSSSSDAACADYARAYCAEIAACRANNVEANYGDLATCETRRTATCIDSYDSPDTGNTSDRTESCAQEMATESCPDFIQNHPPEACLPIAGARALDESCAYNSECASAFCAVGAHDQCGTCAPPPVPGDDCTDSGCGLGMTCVTATQTCAAWVVDGAQCDTYHPCTPESTCVTPANAIQGTCVASGTAVGVACDPKKLAGPVCSANLGLFCNTLTMTCEHMIFVAAGEPCGVISGDDHVCTDGATCFGTPKLCVADADDGSSCDTSVGPACLAPARCVTDGVSTSGICAESDQTQCTPADE